MAGQKQMVNRKGHVRNYSSTDQRAIRRRHTGKSVAILTSYQFFFLSMKKRASRLDKCTHQKCALINRLIDTTEMNSVSMKDVILKYKQSKR